MNQEISPLNIANKIIFNENSNIIHILYSEPFIAKTENDPWNILLNLHHIQVENNILSDSEIIFQYYTNSNLSDISFCKDDDNTQFFSFIHEGDGLPTPYQKAFIIVSNKEGEFTAENCLINLIESGLRNPKLLWHKGYLTLMSIFNDEIINYQLESNYTILGKNNFSEYDRNRKVESYSECQNGADEIYGIWRSDGGYIYFTDNYSWDYSMDLKQCSNNIIIYGTGYDLYSTSIPIELSVNYLPKTDLISPVSGDIFTIIDKRSNDTETLKHLVKTILYNSDSKIYIEYKRSWDSDWIKSTERIPEILNNEEEWYWNTINIPDGPYEFRINSSFIDNNCCNPDPEKISIFLDNQFLNILDIQITNPVSNPQGGAVIGYKISEPASVNIKIKERFTSNLVLNKTITSQGNDRLFNEELMKNEPFYFYWDCKINNTTIPNGPYQMIVTADNEIGERDIKIINFTVNSTANQIQTPIISNVLIIPNPSSILCSQDENIMISYEINGGMDDYLSYIYVKDKDDNLIFTIENGIPVSNGTHSVEWSGIIDPFYDTDEDGLIDKGSYNIRIFAVENKSNGNISNIENSTLSISGDFKNKIWYRQAGYRINPIGTYSHGNIITTYAP